MAQYEGVFIGDIGTQFRTEYTVFITQTIFEDAFSLLGNLTFHPVVQQGIGLLDDLFSNNF